MLMPLLLLPEDVDDSGPSLPYGERCATAAERGRTGLSLDDGVSSGAGPSEIRLPTGERCGIRPPLVRSLALDRELS